MHSCAWYIKPLLLQFAGQQAKMHIYNNFWSFKMSHSEFLYNFWKSKGHFNLRSGAYILGKRTFFPDG